VPQSRQDSLGATAPNLALREIGPGVRLQSPTPGGKVGTLEDSSAAADLLAAIRNTTNQPIKFVAHTRRPLDHARRLGFG